MNWQNDLTKRALALRMLGIGWYIAFCLILGAVGGYWLDSRLNNAFPMFALIGLTLGLVVAFYGIYRIVRPLMKEEQKKTKGED